MQSPYIVCLQSDREIGAMLAKCLADLGGIEKLVKPRSKILLKPNLAVEKPNSSGATTNPALIEALVAQLTKVSPQELIIGESSGLGHSTTKAFAVTGIKDIAERWGVTLKDFKKERHLKIPVPKGKALDYVNVPRTVLAADVIINLPILKVHSQTQVTIGLKNLKGCISDNDKRRFHRLDLEQCIADLNTVIRPQLVVVDATTCSFAWEEGGSPVKLNTILAGQNPVATDFVGATLLGYDPADIVHLRLAGEHGLGPTKMDEIKVVSPERIEKYIFSEDEQPTRFDLPGTSLITKGVCSLCMGSILASLRRLSREQVNLDCCIVAGQKLTTKDIPRNKKVIGIGKCGAEFVNKNMVAKGCPPKGIDIYELLKNQG